MNGWGLGFGEGFGPELSVSCVVGKREGEEAEVAFSVDRGWNGAREAAW
jgi:hypothetical protein